MSDFIRLLPDSVANQIAAGEVIQRPASAVKELMENAIDAGSTQIKLIIKDAGRTLIQVIDNGTGMTVTDARMCFERHATSKIREAKDLFAIRTLGFRGEALASIAAVAQVELRTRKEADELGTSVIIEGSRIKSQESVSCPKGTSISARNLFFNIPARRNFLKSDSVEFRHILEEFQRIALVHPDVELSLVHNEKPVFQLSKVNLRQRIVHLFGSNINEKLLPVDMKTEQVQIFGFIGKPEAAKRTRGEQYFFANGRFIRHSYLHHAVEQAFEELLPESAIPSYFLFIEVDPLTIDVNIHPTKTEVNFQHDPLLYGSMRSAVKHALGMFTLTPILDFEREAIFDHPLPPGHEVKAPTIRINPDYNPFNQVKPVLQKPTEGLRANRDEWEKVYEIVRSSNDLEPGANKSELFETELSSATRNNHPTELMVNSFPSAKLIQVQNRYIISNVKSGLLIVDQQRAHERILFEQISTMLEKEPGTQQLNLFPITIQLSMVDSDILIEIKNDLCKLGFDINELGGGSFVVNSIPASLPIKAIEEFIGEILEDYKKNKVEPGSAGRVKFAGILAKTIAVKSGKVLQTEEMQSLIDQLFACKVPDMAPDGKQILRILNQIEIEKLLH
ncbi:MAG: DNA mismatch repair endonuclease MutL [Bacteroidales bacterium]|nr:DNA mismatch repair endonuclease MutL [Bacteroidales bacterium]